MAKFIDLNKNKMAKSEEKGEVKPEAKASGEVTVAIEHGAYEKSAQDPTEKPLLTSKIVTPDPPPSTHDDELPPKPDIPRATAAMAPIPPKSDHPYIPPAPLTSRKQKIVTAILSVILIMLLALLVSQAVIFFTNSKKDAAATPRLDEKTTETTAVEKKASTSATPEASADTTAPGSATASTTPAATVTTSLTKEKATVKVLNGSGVGGAAAKAAAVIKEAGFSVSSTSNAKAYTYATTTVYYKDPDAKTLAIELVKTLSAYSVEAKEDASIATGATELVVVVGKK